MDPMIDGDKYKYANHKHELRFHLKAPEPYYVCDCCKMPGDLNPCLKCPYETCSFHLHQVCYKLNHVPEVQHSLFRHCVFELCKESSRKDSDYCGDVPYCDACGLDIEGFRYHCSPYASHPHKNHDLHPTCVHRNLTMKTNIGVELELKDKVKSKCLHCGKKYPVEECIRFTGWKWISKKREFWAFPYCFTGRKICYHLKCMNEKLMQQMK